MPGIKPLKERFITNEYKISSAMLRYYDALDQSPQLISRIIELEARRQYIGKSLVRHVNTLAKPISSSFWTKRYLIQRNTKYKLQHWGLLLEIYRLKSIYLCRLADNVIVVLSEENLKYFYEFCFYRFMFSFDAIFITVKWLTAIIANIVCSLRQSQSSR